MDSKDAEPFVRDDFYYQCFNSLQMSAATEPTEVRAKSSPSEHIRLFLDVYCQALIANKGAQGLVRLKKAFE